MSERISYRSCRCGQAVVILNTERGKHIAVNTDPRGHNAWKFRSVERLETFYRHGSHQPHVITCTRPKVTPPERKRYIQ